LVGVFDPVRLGRRNCGAFFADIVRAMGLALAPLDAERLPCGTAHAVVANPQNRAVTIRKRRMVDSSKQG
jgi:hypothetical protein